jgi:hypothetical protein
MNVMTARELQFKPLRLQLETFARLVKSLIFYTDTTPLFKGAQPNNSIGADCRKLLVLTPRLLTAAQPPGYLAKVFELGQYTEKSDRPNQKATTHV